MIPNESGVYQWLFSHWFACIYNILLLPYCLYRIVYVRVCHVLVECRVFFLVYVGVEQPHLPTFHFRFTTLTEIDILRVVLMSNLRTQPRLLTLQARIDSDIIYTYYMGCFGCVAVHIAPKLFCKIRSNNMFR